METNISKSMRKLLLFFLLLIPMFGFTACGDDNDEPDTPPTQNPTVVKVATVTAQYKILLGQAWFDFFDIVVNYTSVGGDKKVVLTEDMMENFTLPYSESPNTFICSIVAKPKSTHPEIKENGKYNLSNDIEASVFGKDANGTEIDGFGYMGSNYSVFPEASAKELKSKMEKERTLLNFSYTLEPSDIRQQ